MTQAHAARCTTGTSASTCGTQRCARAATAPTAPRGSRSRSAAAATSTCGRPTPRSTGRPWTTRPWPARNYIASSGSGTITAPLIKTYIEVPIIDDDVEDSGEKFKIVISNPGPEGVGLDHQWWWSFVTINNDDSPETADADPNVRVEDAAADEDASEIVFAVKLDEAADESVTVAYSTADGTATRRRGLHDDQRIGDVRHGRYREERVGAYHGRRYRRGRRGPHAHPVERLGGRDRRRHSHGHDPGQRRRGKGDHHASCRSPTQRRTRTTAISSSRSRSTRRPGTR